MSSTTERVEMLVAGLFGPGSEQRTLERLAHLANGLAPRLTERVLAAVVLSSHGDEEMLEEQIGLAELDRRDVLVSAGLADDDWSARLDHAVKGFAIVQWDGPPADAWDAWTPWEIAERFDGLDVAWCVVGGWAIDLALGETTRTHEDLEVAVPRRHLPAVRQHLAEYSFHTAGGGAVRLLDPSEDTPPHLHQHWVLDAVAGRWRVDVMAEPGDDKTWAYRREPSFQAPRSFMVTRSVDGIPYLRPHGALLFKAKASRPKDRRDFDAAVKTLDGPECSWLRDALERFHPGHPWIGSLRS